MYHSSKSERCDQNVEKHAERCSSLYSIQVCVELSGFRPQGVAIATLHDIYIGHINRDSIAIVCHGKAERFVQ